MHPVNKKRVAMTTIKSIMLKTALAHAIIAVVIQGVLSSAIGLMGGGIGAVLFYLGREITQHEYKGGSWDKNLPWHYGITHHWTLDSVLDLAAPVIACTVVYYAASWIGGLGPLL